MEFKHASVLLWEVIRELEIKPDGIYVDGTLGGGGHSFHIAEKLSENGKLYGIDQDTEALKAAGERLSVYGNKVEFIHDNYENMVRDLKERGVKGVDGILLDLGVSSYQLDNPERGFSYRMDAPLDMRMDQTGPVSAADIVNTASESELIRILREYGEEKCAVNIARNILKRRAQQPFERTSELADIVYASIPARMREKGGNPCKRTFQAFRIACNRELEVLSDSLDGMIEFLNPGGRITIITFQSLEDRIVKTAFRKNENPCICPPEFPVCMCGRKSKGKVITRKAILPGEEELAENRRSASAKLRVFEKTTED